MYNIIIVIIILNNYRWVLKWNDCCRRNNRYRKAKYIPSISHFLLLTFKFKLKVLLLDFLTAFIQKILLINKTFKLQVHTTKK